MSSSEPNGVLVIVVYEPKSGRDDDLAGLIARHESTLRTLDLVTDRPFVHGRAKNGSFIELFEWKSEAASRSAHDQPAIQELWGAMGEACEFKGLSSLDESNAPFAHFDPMSFSSGK